MWEFIADVKSYANYYPFGMEMPGRTSNSSSYRYGYNGKEKDNEILGNGNVYDFGARLNDVRLGRWFSTDPEEKHFAFRSTYTSFSDNPINRSDPSGRADYYTQEGNKIGTDGKGDGKMIVIKDDAVINQIETNTKNSTPTQTTELANNSFFILPNANVRKAMGDAVLRSSQPNKEVGDEYGNRHEEGGVWATNEDGSQVAYEAEAGNESSIDFFKLKNINKVAHSIMDGTFHVHPKLDGKQVNQKGVISNKKPEYGAAEPSKEDIIVSKTSKGIVPSGLGVVLAPAENKAAFYNENGIIITFPLDTLTKTGNEEPVKDNEIKTGE